VPIPYQHCMKCARNIGSECWPTKKCD
jgi:hypothetical protein